jgi:DnaJ-class molecular chaperone
MSDYYNILGLSRGASDDDIKASYRKLARQHHPDKGGDKEFFQKIQEAYETLSDSSKKQQYDNPMNMNTGIDNMFPFGFEHPFFKHHTRQQQIVKKSDHTYSCRITLKEVYTGTIKKLKINRKRICKICISNCKQCGGNGVSTQHVQMGPFTQVVQQTCNKCGGTGKFNDNTIECSSCNSLGTINEENVFEIKIKRGAISGENFVFHEWGEQAVKDNEISGNFVVNIIIENDKNFRRDNMDLLYTINLTFRESVVGKVLTIPHFGGDIVLDTRGFGLINPNKEYIIYNKGLLDENEKSGNLRLKYQITYPEKTFDEFDIDTLTDAFNKVGLK